MENQYNQCLNSFFTRHSEIAFKHGMRILYLPSLSHQLADDELLKYLNPAFNVHDGVSIPVIDSTFLLKDLCYPEDAEQLKHGLIWLCGWSYNHGAKFLNGHYCPLSEGDDTSILSQIENIAKEVYSHNAGGLYSTDNRPSVGLKPNKDFADEQFDWEINTLLDEVRERIEKLEQRGISRNLLLRYLGKEPELSRIVITKDFRIVLPDYNNMEIKMEPINKAVYLLFLRHPEGIIFKHLPDYRKELANLYQLIKPHGLNERAIRSIEDVTNPCLNSINEKCARIRGAFVSKFDDHLARQYYIFGYRGEPKKIILPRDMVVWE